MDEIREKYAGFGKPEFDALASGPPENVEAFCNDIRGLAQEETAEEPVPVDPRQKAREAKALVDQVRSRTPVDAASSGTVSTVLFNEVLGEAQRLAELVPTEEPAPAETIVAEPTPLQE